MGFIKEPRGVDLVVDSRPITDKDQKEISDFIRKSKTKRQSRSTGNAAKKQEGQTTS